jgi:hypothetical protein
MNSGASVKSRAPALLRLAYERLKIPVLGVL